MLNKIYDLLRDTKPILEQSCVLLPEPLRTETAVAYLLCRAIDRIASSASVTAAARLQAMSTFVELLEGRVFDRSETNTGLDVDRFCELRESLPTIRVAVEELRIGARTRIRDGVRRSASAAAVLITKSDARYQAEIATMEELRQYCAAVSGTVFETWTELVLIDRQCLEKIANDLRARAGLVGEGLRLVKILRDAPDRHVAGDITLLPRRAHSREVLALAESDLAAATTYAGMLRAARAEAGIVSFVTLIVELGLANLRRVRAWGIGAKLSQSEIAKITVECATNGSATSAFS
jgi:phytoene/squalene synthetase